MRNYFRRATHAATSIFMASCFSTAGFADTIFGPFGRWNPSIETSYEASPSEVGSTVYQFLTPLVQGDDWLIFSDVRAHNFLPDWREGNLGVVIRKRWEPVIIGAYGFLDVQRSAADNTFWQGTLGLELLSEFIDFRVRGTAPFDDAKQALGASAALIENGNIIFYQGEENALSSAEADLRFRLPVDQTFGRRADFWIGADAAVYDHDNIDRQIVWGASFEARLNDGVFGIVGSRITAEFAAKKAEGFDPALIGALRVRLPLGPSPRTPNTEEDGFDRLDARMTDRIQHAFYAPVLPLPTGPTEDIYDNDTNILLNKYAELDDQAAILVQNAAISGAPTENTLFHITGDNGPYAGSLLVGQNRTYVGGGSTIDLRGGTSNTVVQFTASGVAPQFVQTASTPIVSVQGSNSHVAGMNLLGAGSPGFFNHGFGGTGANSRIDGLSNVVIEQNTITSAGFDGIGFDQNNSQIVVRDNVILNSGGDGIAFEQLNTDVQILNNTINGTGIIGIATGSNNTFFSVVGNSISNTTNAAFVVSSNSSFTDFSNNVFAGTIGGDLIDLVGTGNSLQGTGNNAFNAIVGGDFCGNGNLALPVAFTGSIGFDTAPLSAIPIVLQSGSSPCF